MPKVNPPTVKLPPNAPNGDLVALAGAKSVVIVGANGSGKSRLGAWIARSQPGIVHRVSAQRLLVFKPEVAPKPLGSATDDVLYGGTDARANLTQRKSSEVIVDRAVTTKWNGQPTVNPLRDYNEVLSWIVAEEANVASDYLARSKMSVEKVPLPETRLDVALRIWGDVMPQRTLLVRGHKVTARADGAESYPAVEMSDGERVAFYLIAKCLAIPDGSIVVIDEPELHLHQAIQTRLWDLIEEACPACVFVYITHDLAFAASRTAARTFWLREYRGKEGWEWREVPKGVPFPDALTLKILGSRRQVLFVEGQAGGLDEALYRALYPKRLVVSCGGCENVIHSTRILRERDDLHHTEAYGIIDRDRRSEEELTKHAAEGVYALDVAEFENLFLTPEVAKFVCTRLMRNSEATLQSVQRFMFDSLKGETATQISERAAFLVQQQLNNLAAVAKAKGDKAEFCKAVNGGVSAIDAGAVYDQCEALFKDIVEKQDYALLLRYYNRKSLARRASELLGLGKDELPAFVIRLLQNQAGSKLAKALRARLPRIPEA